MSPSDPDAVAILLGDDLPAERLGELLRAARKRHGWTRKQAARHAGTTAQQLHAYEHAQQRVPADVLTRLAATYGAELTAHVPTRDPLNAAVGSLDGPADDVIARYLTIVRELRGERKRNKPLALRASDLAALAAALGHERDELEARIAEHLGCTRDEAHALHNELLRRKIVVPVVGLAAGVAAFAGVAHAAEHPTASPTARNAEPTTVVSTTAAPTTEPPPPPPPPATTTTTTATTLVSAPPAPLVPATVPSDQRAPTAPAPIPSTHADQNDSTVSVLPGETPITIIGEPDTPPSAQPGSQPGNRPDARP
ncbi:MAG TPA: helix-turn-helix transcriptional regulator [Acidimicrobiia bacterium]|nr:helix-turn-helix transcriptional regulator [Acidimicrobiia bacterium]